MNSVKPKLQAITKNYRYAGIGVNKLSLRIIFTRIQHLYGALQ